MGFSVKVERNPKTCRQQISSPRRTLTSLRVVGRESVSGIETWRIEAIRTHEKLEYWVEEPGFRVHKVVAEGGPARIEIRSYFGDESSDLPSQWDGTKIVENASLP